MARPKTLIKNIEVTEAKREHSCRSNSNHKISRGDLRLTVKEGQSEHNYCMDCGKRFMDSAISELCALREKYW